MFRKYLEYAKYLIFLKKCNIFKKIFFEYLDIIVVSTLMIYDIQGINPWLSYLTKVTLIIKLMHFIFVVGQSQIVFVLISNYVITDILIHTSDCIYEHWTIYYLTYFLTWKYQILSAGISLGISPLGIYASWSSYWNIVPIGF